MTKLMEKSRAKEAIEENRHQQSDLSLNESDTLGVGKEMEDRMLTDSAEKLKMQPTIMEKEMTMATAKSTPDVKPKAQACLATKPPPPPTKQQKKYAERRARAEAQVTREEKAENSKSYLQRIKDASSKLWTAISGSSSKQKEKKLKRPDIIGELKPDPQKNCKFLTKFL